MTDRRPHHVPPPPTRFGQAKPSAVQPRAAIGSAGTAGYRITVGSYLHKGQAGLPPEIAGHTFVAIEEPTGKRQAWGFSPAGFDNMDPRRDLTKLTAGVRGRVHSDNDGFSKPGVRTRTFDVGPAEARAAMAKVAEYRANTPRFSLATRQCSTFTTDVLKAARIDAFPGAGVRRPQQIYGQLAMPQPKKK